MTSDSSARIAVDQRDEVDLAERRLQDEDAALTQEIARLVNAQKEVERRLKSVRTLVAEASLAGEQDKAMTERVARMVVPEGAGIELHVEAAKSARRHAVEERVKAGQAIRSALTLWKQQLAATVLQLQADDKTAHAMLDRAKEKAAAVARKHPPLPLITAPTPVLFEEVEEPSVEIIDSSERETAVEPKAMLAPPAAPVVTPPPQIAPQQTMRSSPRVKLQVAIDLASDHNFFTGFSANISDGGIFVATVNHLELGTPVELSFTLPDGKKLHVHGQVRWIREISEFDPNVLPGLGIQFQDLPSAAANAIRSFVAQREPMFLAAD